MVTLSERQQKMLSFIIAFYREEEFPPTIREIGEKVGISSTSVVNYNLTRLEELELLTRQEKVSRGLALNWTKLVECKLVDEMQVPGAEGNSLRVPLLGHIAAGEPIQPEVREQRNPAEWIDMCESMVGASQLAHLDKLYALRVEGDSMVDASVLDGDIVIIHHQEQAENGQMVVAWIEGDEETTLKYWNLDGDKVRLKPANPNYKEIVRPADKVRVMGRVVSVIRYLS